MPITRIKVDNFRSFQSIDIDLRKLNIVVGTNASGKSNFVQIFRFLNDAVEQGLENAISIQGGQDYITNAKIRAEQKSSIEMHFSPELDTEIPWPIPVRKSARKTLAPQIISGSFRIEIGFKRRGKGIKTVESTLTLATRIYSYKRKGKSFVRHEDMGSEVRLTIKGSNLRKKATILMESSGENILSENDLFPETLRRWLDLGGGRYDLPLAKYLSYLILPHIVGGTAIYDFDPKMAKRGAQITGRVELEGDGSNLALVLRRVVKDKSREKKFLTLISDLLPFIDRIGTQDSADKSVLVKAKERYYPKTFVYAPFMSDGTINVIALVLALYFSYKPLIIIEEPERNIHPYLIDKVMDMMDDASNKTQIIVTTHNAVLVGNADPQNVILMSRDSDGFSRVSRPCQKEEVKEFLRKEIGLGELLEQNLLEDLT
jgi:predicted ATPase